MAIVSNASNASGFGPLRIVEADIKKLEQTLKSLPDELAHSAGKRGLVNGGKLVRGDVKRKIQSNGLVDTGELLKSIQLQEKVRYKGKTLFGVNVIAKRGKRFPGGYYAHLKERGHNLFWTTRWRKVFIKFVPARPFMRPTAESPTTQSKAVEAYRIAIKRAVDRYRPNAI